MYSQIFFPYIISFVIIVIVFTIRLFHYAYNNRHIYNKESYTKIQKYFDSRKDLKYYQTIYNILENLPDDNNSILDVGGWKGEFLSKVDGFTSKTVIDLHKKPENFPKDITFINENFLTVNLTKKYDIVICMQVLEHIDKKHINQFTQKLFQYGKNVLISVPYKWKKGFCKYHLHDPVNEAKLKLWTKREPQKTWIVTENNNISRLIALYY